MHGWGPHQSHVGLALGEEPERFFGSFGASFVAVEHQVYAVDAELFCEAGDLFALLFRHAV